MKKVVDRAVACERAFSAEIAAAWPTGVRFPYLPVFEVGEAADDVANMTATADPGDDRHPDRSDKDPE